MLAELSPGAVRQIFDPADAADRARPDPSTSDDAAVSAVPPAADPGAAAAPAAEAVGRSRGRSSSRSSSAVGNVLLGITIPAAAAPPPSPATADFDESTDGVFRYRRPLLHDDGDDEAPAAVPPAALPAVAPIRSSFLCAAHACPSLTPARGPSPPPASNVHERVLSSPLERVLCAAHRYDAAEPPPRAVLRASTSPLLGARRAPRSPSLGSRSSSRSQSRSPSHSPLGRGPPRPAPADLSDLLALPASKGGGVPRPALAQRRPSCERSSTSPSGGIRASGSSSSFLTAHLPRVRESGLIKPEPPEAPSGPPSRSHSVDLSKEGCDPEAMLTPDGRSVVVIPDGSRGALPPMVRIAGPAAARTDEDLEERSAAEGAAEGTGGDDEFTGTPEGETEHSPRPTQA